MDRRHRRDRAKSHVIGKANLTANQRGWLRIRKIKPWDCFGMTRCKCFRILVRVEGRGMIAGIAVIADIAEIGKAKPHR